MANDFEDRLRQSLQARAQDVTPDPALYREVQSRIRRGRFLRWSLAGAGAVAVVALAALTVPSVLDRRIEFDPAPVATQPASEEPAVDATEAPLGAMPVPDGMVFSDGPSTYLMALDGESATTLSDGDPAVRCPQGDCTSEPYISAVAVAPGSSFDAATIVERRAAGCGELRWGRADLAGEEQSFDGGELGLPGQCPTPAVFSPDGGHLAWVAAEPSGQWNLSTVDWTADGPGDEDATFGLEIGPADDVRIEDWVWTGESDTGATGHLVLSGENDVGERALFLQPIERQADGALALSMGVDHTFGAGENGAIALAFADAQTPAGTARVTYAIEVPPDEDVRQAWLVKYQDERFSVGLGLPADLYDKSDPAAAASDLWLSAMGDTVLFGDGHGKAWRSMWTGDGWEGPFLLEGTIVHADLFGGGAMASEEPASSTVTVRVYFGKSADDLCAHGASVKRRVPGPGVARAALNQLFAGPTDQERAEGYASPFGPDTADALQDIRITDGVAEVDLRDIRGILGDDRCITENVSNSIMATALQFPTVTDVRVSFDGDEAAWAAWLNSDLPVGAPGAVLDTAQRIRAAAAARDYDALAELADQEYLSCSFSDQNEDCIAVWQEQERRGEDPLGVMVEVLSGEPAKNPRAPIWAWPVEYIVSNDYLGPRLGIDRQGRWRFFVQGGD